MGKSKNKEYYIKPEQAKVLEELENLIGKTIPLKKKISQYTFGVQIDGNDVIGLGLHHRKLCFLPNSIGNLTSLRTLNLARNRFKILPETIGELKSLKTLNIFNCKLKELPESIGKLQSLEILKLNYNDLEELPESIGNLHSLKEVDLRENYLIGLPESITELTTLQVLDLSENDIYWSKNQDKKTKSIMKQLKEYGVKFEKGEQAWLKVFVFGNMLILAVGLIVVIFSIA